MGGKRERERERERQVWWKSRPAFCYLVPNLVSPPRKECVGTRAGTHANPCEQNTTQLIWSNENDVTWKLSAVAGMAMKFYNTFYHLMTDVWFALVEITEQNNVKLANKSSSETDLRCTEQRWRFSRNISEFGVCVTLKTSRDEVSNGNGCFRGTWLSSVMRHVKNEGMPLLIHTHSMFSINVTVLTWKFAEGWGKISFFDQIMCKSIKFNQLINLCDNTL